MKILNSQKRPLGVIVIPKIKPIPYLSELYSRLGRRINVFDLNRLISKQSWRLIFYRKKANVIHIHWLEYLYRYRIHKLYLIFALIVPCLLLICKYMFRYKLIVTLHNIKPHEPVLLDKSMFRIVLNLCNRIVVHNNFSTEQVLAIYGGNLKSKLAFIPHGNFISYYPNEISRNEARIRLGLRDDDFVLLFFGALRPYKGIELLLDAFKMVSRHKKNIVLLIAGAVSKKPAIIYHYGDLIRSEVQKLENCFLKAEHIPDDEVQVYLKAANVGVLPYKEITTPGTMFLFMSFKKPMIVPDIPAIRETGSEDFCFFFKRDNAKSLSEAILRAYGCKNMLQEMGIYAYSKALLFDWDTISHKILNLYS